MFLPKGALMEPFRQLNFTERGLITHFSNAISSAMLSPIKILEINCKIMFSLFASDCLTILPHIFNYVYYYCFNPNLLYPKTFFLSSSISFVSFTLDGASKY